jgi:hypothetical protein
VNGHCRWCDVRDAGDIIRASYDQAAQNRARVLGNIYLNHPGGDTVRLAFRTIMQNEFIGTEDGQDLYYRCRDLIAYEVVA